MIARFRPWRQKIWQHRVAIAVATAILVVAIVLIIVGYRFDITGFNGYTQVSTIHTLSGPSAGTVTRTETYQPGKTLWDWLGLLAALAIPVVVGIGAAWFTVQQAKASDRENKDNQREAALQAYIDAMSELLLEKHLGELTPEGKLKPEYNEVRKIARVRTLTVLHRLDPIRKRNVLQFLHESNMIDKGQCIVDLSGADLSEVDLSRIQLTKAELRSTNLRKANLYRTFLLDADLSDADLRGADLSELNDPRDIIVATVETLVQTILPTLPTLMNAVLTLPFHAPSAKEADTDVEKASTTITHQPASYRKSAKQSDTDVEKASTTITVDFRRAVITEAKLERARLSRANLSKVKLERANLTGADLSEANLWGADLSEANLIGADLSGANLSDAILIGAKVTSEQLKRAKSLEGAVMPYGLKHA